eukprot:CAMPEP_0195150346 /NCGR_PEP_ID=MMETSP0448-20130528/178640_1 /TAXON_ID=66468 /ORGANISM="Heterocapsa triquestra, Strain CCMP 448" /LENGTH=146 /DNA_ID=CAMNT_0040189023 /DNA_START=44 /DNA_END=481 /DNA_ORIENTATION=+
MPREGHEKPKKKEKKDKRHRSEEEAQQRAIRDVYQQLIEAVYRRYNDEKYSDIPRLMEKYEGQEAEIYDKIVRKYVFCLERSNWLPLIEAMYRRFNASKLADLDRILEKYQDSEAALYKALCDKYILTWKLGEEPLMTDAWSGVAE